MEEISINDLMRGSKKATAGIISIVCASGGVESP